MRKLEYLSFFENNNLSETIILNRTTGKSIRVNNFLMEVLDGAKSIEDIKSLALDYQEEDRKFFERFAGAAEKSELFKDKFATDKIKSLSFIITDKCNLYCKHCCFSAKCVGHTESHIKFDKNVFRSILNLQPEDLSITGGEPLLLENFNELMDMINKNHKGKSILCTNGTLISEENAEKLCRCFDAFDISLDGYDEASTDEIRGKGVFKKVISAIEILKKHNPGLIRLSCAIKSNSEDDRIKFEKFCEEIGVVPTIRRMSLIGRASENKMDDVSDYSCFTDLSVTSCNECAGGKTTFTVTWNGDIYPCNNFVSPEFKMCSILNENFRSKLGWNEDNYWFKIFSEYLPNKRKECKNCEVNLFCWNCPSIVKAFLESRGIDSLCSVCAEKKQKIKETIWA